LPKSQHGEECRLGKGSHSFGPGMLQHCIGRNEWLHSPVSIKLIYVSRALILPADERAVRGQYLISGTQLLIHSASSSNPISETACQGSYFWTQTNSGQLNTWSTQECPRLTANWWSCLLYPVGATLHLQMCVEDVVN